MRYFFIAYAFKYADSDEMGFGQMIFQSDRYPQAAWITREVKYAVKGYIESVIIINIQELSEGDYQSFTDPKIG